MLSGKIWDLPMPQMWRNLKNALFILIMTAAAACGTNAQESSKDQQKKTLSLFEATHVPMTDALDYENRIFNTAAVDMSWKYWCETQSREELTAALLPFVLPEARYHFPNLSNYREIYEYHAAWVFWHGDCVDRQPQYLKRVYQRLTIEDAPSTFQSLLRAQSYQYTGNFAFIMLTEQEQMQFSFRQKLSPVSKQGMVTLIHDDRRAGRWLKQNGAPVPAAIGNMAEVFLAGPAAFRLVAKMVLKEKLDVDIPVITAVRWLDMAAGINDDRALAQLVSLLHMNVTKKIFDEHRLTHYTRYEHELDKINKWIMEGIGLRRPQHMKIAYCLVTGDDAAEAPRHRERVRYELLSTLASYGSPVAKKLTTKMTEETSLFTRVQAFANKLNNELSITLSDLPETTASVGDCPFLREAHKALF
jgi:hypothetical protein